MSAEPLHVLGLCQALYEWQLWYSSLKDKESVEEKPRKWIRIREQKIVHMLTVRCDGSVQGKSTLDGRSLLAMCRFIRASAYH